jgi:hypothetical protein
MKPSIGRIVIYRSRTGEYDVPAIINCTTDSLNPKGVEAGHIPALSSDTHVHLTVFSPGKPGLRLGAQNFVKESAATFGDEQVPVSENVSGCYQEWDVAYDEVRDAEVPAGTWRWPERV